MSGVDWFDPCWSALMLATWVAPWHVNRWPLSRPTWTPPNCLNGVLAIVFGVAWVVGCWFHVFDLAPNHLYVGLIQAGSASYGLYRAWRDQNPPRRKLRDRASDLGRRLADSMTPARVPLPVASS